MTDPHRPHPRYIAALILIALLLAPVLLPAQPAGGPYTMRRHVIGAGGEATGGPYRLVGTVAETGAGVSSASGWRLTGGFHGADRASDRIFCHGFENTACP